MRRQNITVMITYVLPSSQPSDRAGSPMANMKDLLPQNEAQNDNSNQPAGDDVFSEFPRFPDFASFQDMLSMQE